MSLNLCQDEGHGGGKDKSEGLGLELGSGQKELCLVLSRTTVTHLRMVSLVVLSTAMIFAATVESTPLLPDTLQVRVRDWVSLCEEVVVLVSSFRDRIDRVRAWG